MLSPAAFAALIVGLCRRSSPAAPAESAQNTEPQIDYVKLQQKCLADHNYRAGFLRGYSEGHRAAVEASTEVYVDPETGSKSLRFKRETDLVAL